ncbi:hypothetical protein L7F22_026607 [Adiantum nelumboides]|nr:hypothetical protein [Adiantum nelumboides]
MVDSVDRQLDPLQAALLSTQQGCYKMGARRLAAALHLQTCLHGLEAIIKPQYRPRAEAQVAMLLAAKRVAASHHGVVPPLNEAIVGTLLISLLVLAFAFSTFTAPSTLASLTSTIHSTCKRIVPQHRLLFINQSGKHSVSTCIKNMRVDMLFLYTYQ